MSYNDERAAATKAKAVVDTLTTAIQRTDANVRAVRLAAGTATDAIKNFSSEGPLDAARHEAAIAVSCLCGPMHRRTMITGI